MLFNLVLRDISPTKIDDWRILISKESDGDWTMQFTVNSVARSDGCIYLNIKLWIKLYIKFYIYI